MNHERFQRLAAFVIAVLTALAAVIGYLQNDAGAKDDRANRDSKRYAVQAFGRQVSGQAQVHSDYYQVYQAHNEFWVQSLSADTHGESADSALFEEMAEEMRKLSPLLSGDYYDKKLGEPDVARYEAYTYLVEVTRLGQLFKASAAVKDGWDYKANTYVVHLTLLAVALFLWGLAATIAGPSTRGLFAVSGTAVAVWATVWAGTLWAQPVFDLRTAGQAIEEYAQASGLEHRAGEAGEKAPELRKEALKHLDASLAAAPDYLDALLLRSEVRALEDQLEPAAQDLQKAVDLDPGNAEARGRLAGIYYTQGRFEEARRAVAMALAVKPDEAWLVFDAGLVALASGQVDQAKASYKRGVEMVAQRMAAAVAAKEEPPSDLLEALFAASADLQELAITIEEKKGVPPPDKIARPQEVAKAAQELSREMASAEMALEYTGKLSPSKLQAKLGELAFTQTSDDGSQDKPEAEEFSGDISQISVHFEYSGMKDGQNVIFRIYHNGVEDASWRVVEPWEGGAQGEYEQVLSPGYTETFKFEPGEYLVEVYVDFQLAQSGSFLVKTQ